LSLIREKSQAVAGAQEVPRQHLEDLAAHYRTSGQESAGIAAFYDELSGQTSERIAGELGEGSLGVLIRSLTGAELVRLLVRLADLRESLEEEKVFCSAAMVSLCQDRVRDELLMGRPAIRQTRSAFLF
jgi:hypothetical protein